MCLLYFVIDKIFKQTNIVYKTILLPKFGKCQSYLKS